MAEDIAANMSYTDDQELVSRKIADHLDRFWDPRYRNIGKDIKFPKP